MNDAQFQKTIKAICPVFLVLLALMVLKSYNISCQLVKSDEEEEKQETIVVEKPEENVD